MRAATGHIQNLSSLHQEKDSAIHKLSKKLTKIQKKNDFLALTNNQWKDETPHEVRDDLNSQGS